MGTQNGTYGNREEIPYRMHGNMEDMVTHKRSPYGTHGSTKRNVLEHAKDHHREFTGTKTETYGNTQ